MNRERVLELADWIEKLPPEDFDMTTWRHGCQSPACIAGHAFALFEPKLFANTIGSEYSRAKSALGLNRRRAADLFTPDGLMDRTTNIQAARVLRHLAETGVVDWTIINQ